MGHIDRSCRRARREASGPARGERDEQGASMTEYALVVAGVAVSIIGVVQAFGGLLYGFILGLVTQLL